MAFLFIIYFIIIIKMSEIIRNDLLSLKESLLLVEKDFEDRLAQMEEKREKFDKIDRKLMELLKVHHLLMYVLNLLQ